MKTGSHLLLAFFTCLFQSLCAQENDKKNHVEQFPFTDLHWIVVSSEGSRSEMQLQNYKNRRSIQLEPGQTAFLKNKKYRNFQLEFYCNGQFPGVGFRIQDKKNYEYLYLRVPLSGHEDAMQYVPVYNGSLPWQLYNYPQYEGKAEFPKENVATIPLSFEKNLTKGKTNDELLTVLRAKGLSFSSESLIDFSQDSIQYIFDPEDKKALLIEKENNNYNFLDFRTWIHVKLVVLGDKMAIYIDDMDVPAFKVANLKGIANAGGISLIGDFDKVYFSAVAVTEIETQKMLGAMSINLPDTYLTQWKVSEPFVKDSVNFLSQIDSLTTFASDFNTIEADADGLINISRFYDDMTKTVALTCNLISNSDTSVNLNFDYADHLVVLLNSKVCFDQGMNFRPPPVKGKEGRVFVEDEHIKLNLRKGKNELIFLLSGDNRQKYNWGFIAKLDSTKGIMVE